MSTYAIHQSSGVLLTNLDARVLDTTSTSLALIGYRVPSWGEALNENFIFLLENFADTTPPVNPLPGQLWYNTEEKTLLLHDSEGLWKKANGTTVAAVSPAASDSIGDLWWDTVRQQLSVWSGTSWVVIGPANTTVGGLSGLIADSVNDSTNVQRFLLIFYVTGVPVAVISNNPIFTTSVLTDDPFVVNPGFNLLVASHLYNGTASDADRLGGTLPSDYVRKDLPIALTETVTLNNTLTVNNVQIDQQSTQGVISVPTNNSLSINVNRNNNFGTPALSVAADGKVTVATGPTAALGVATKQYVDDRSGGVNSLNLWSALQTFGTSTFRLVDNVASPAKDLRIGLASAQGGVVTMNIPADTSSFTPAISGSILTSGLTISSGRRRLGRTINNSGPIEELFPDFPVGGIVFLPSKTAPNATWVRCDGSTLSRTTYNELFGVLTRSQANTIISSADPGVVIWNNHGLAEADPVRFTTAGELPTAIATAPGVTTFYVKNVTTNYFELSATANGAALDTIAGDAGGNHTVWYAPFGLGDFSTTFGIPSYPSTNAAPHFGVEFVSLYAFIKVL